MCVKLPEDRGTMLDVSGVGQAKYEKYGQRFLTAIREYREKQGDMEICETAEEAADYQKQNRRKVPSIAQNITEPTIDRREPAAPGMLRKTRNLSGNLVSG